MMDRTIDWQKLIDDYQRSTLTQKMFCKKHNIAHSTFKNKYYRQKNMATKFSKVVPINIVPNACAVRQIHLTNGIEINLPNNVDVDKETLVKLLEVFS